MPPLSSRHVVRWAESAPGRRKSPARPARRQCATSAQILRLKANVKPGEDDQEQQHLDAHALAILELGLGRPAQELRDIVRHLLDGATGAVGEGHLVGVQRRRHRDHVAREIGVVVAAVRHLDVRRRLLVAGEQAVEVALAPHPCLGHQGQVRRGLAAVGRRRSLRIGVGAAHVVERQAGPVEHLALVVRPVVHRRLGRDRLDLVLAVAEAGEVAVGHELDAMAGRADLAVDLEAALDRCTVEGAEHAVGGPAHALERDVALGGPGRRRQQAGGGECEGGQRDPCAHAHHPHSAGCADMPARAQHGPVDAGRHGARPLQLAEQRQEDQEVDEIVEGRRTGRSRPRRGSAPDRRPR